MARLGENRYGKSRVRLSRITRHDDRHTFQEWNLRVLLQGDFESSFTDADNSKVLPTDTMKNTVYSLARDSRAAVIEEFAIELGDYLLESNPQVNTVSVDISERSWKPLVVQDRPDPHTFKLDGPELQTAQATRTRGLPWSVTSGIDGLTILKTTKSAFEGFIRDKLTTLKPAADRIFGTCATVTWQFGSSEPEYSSARAQVLSALTG